MWTKLHIKGKLHNHDGTIHLQDHLNKEVIDHICIANINPALDKDSQIFWQNRIVHCVNNFDELVEALRNAKAYLNNSPKAGDRQVGMMIQQAIEKAEMKGE